MLVVVTGGASPLAAAVAQALSALGHTVRLTDRPGRSLPTTGVPCALEADDATEALLGGVQQIVHVEPAIGSENFGGDDVALLDACTRCTYNLLTAASASGVERCIILSSMAVFEAYAADLGVQANWEPRPTCDMAQLAPHMAEFAGREFALSGGTRVLAARLGSILPAPPPAGDSAHRWWASADDVASIVASAVDTPLPAGFSPVYTHFETVNIGRGDGRDVDENGETVDGWWQKANGGNLAWERPEPPPLPPLVSADPQNVLLLGGSGMLGPDVVRALAGDLPQPGRDPSRSFSLKISDVIDRPAIRDTAQAARSDSGNANSTASAAQDSSSDPHHEYASCDITNLEEVIETMAGCDVAIVCSVVRGHPVHAFHVNCRGVFNALRAAVDLGHARLINTGPKEVHAGHQYRAHHHLGTDGPGQSGLDVYSLTKGLGNEVARVFTQNFPIYVLTTLHGSFPSAEFGGGAEGGVSEAMKTAQPGDGMPQAICSTFEDAARAVRCCVEVPLADLPSRYEAFFILPDTAGQVYDNEKAKTLLGWRPVDALAEYFTRELPPGTPRPSGARL